MQCFNKDIGSLGEHLGENYIKNQGYIIIGRNFRCKFGEIDIIGKDNDYIAFIEVKARYNDYYGRPSEAVSYYKQNKLIKTAEFYIMKNKFYNYNFRFDVIEILLNLETSNYKLRLIKNAFQV